jgi:hypothetical protein
VRDQIVPQHLLVSSNTLKGSQTIYGYIKDKDQNHKLVEINVVTNTLVKSHDIEFDTEPSKIIQNKDIVVILEEYSGFHYFNKQTELIKLIEGNAKDIMLNERNQVIVRGGFTELILFDWVDYQYEQK